jgi:Na+/glutamate symporter
MALIQIHKIMIGTAVSFCGLFAVRCLLVGDVTLGAGFGTATALLAIYFRWFLKTKRDGNSGAGADNPEA